MLAIPPELLSEDWEQLRSVFIHYQRLEMWLSKSFYQTSHVISFANKIAVVKMYRKMENFVKAGVPLTW